MKRTVWATLPLLALLSSVTSAQNVDAMAKWTSYEVIRYRAVGEFSGDTLILLGTTHGFRRTAKVTDRVELEFRWNQNEMKLVGEPVINNFATEIISISQAHEVGMTDCPPSRIEGKLEFVTVLSVKADELARLSGMLGLESKRDQPAGAIPYPGPRGGKCGAAWDVSPAKSETTTANFMVPPAMTLAMPGGAPFTLTPDGKSIVIKERGWVWTITPTPVK